MGGKGKRRREKNYRAAHGGHTRLPPPPDACSLDAVPSKLRKLMSLTECRKPKILGAEKKNGDGVKVSDKKLLLGDKVGSRSPGPGRDSEDAKLIAEDFDLGVGIAWNSMHDKKKKKRKRNNVNDLRFEALELASTGSKRKERRKKCFEEKKKKYKMINEKNEEGLLRDEIKFGEVVEAPPKLLVVPKAMKNSHDASKERLRLQAIEAYRKRKGWTSRLGLQLPQNLEAALS